MKNQSGALHVPMALALFLVSLTAAGTLGLLLRWHHLAATQIRLDRCVGNQVLELKKMQEKLEGSNRLIVASRAAIVAALAAPELLPPLREALAAEVAFQEALLLKWKVAQASWAARAGCNGEGSRLPPPLLPEPGWSRPPPDPIGEQPLVYEAARERIVIQLRKNSRVSAAEVRRNEGNQWTAAYVRPGLD